MARGMAGSWSHAPTIDRRSKGPWNCRWHSVSVFRIAPRWISRSGIARGVDAIFWHASCVLQEGFTWSLVGRQLGDCDGNTTVGSIVGGRLVHGLKRCRSPDAWVRGTGARLLIDRTSKQHLRIIFLNRSWLSKGVRRDRRFRGEFDGRFSTFQQTSAWKRDSDSTCSWRLLTESNDERSTKVLTRGQRFRLWNPLKKQVLRRSPVFSCH